MTLDELVELTEEIARTAYRRGWAEALESSAYETPRGRKPPVIPHKDALNEGSANCIGDLRPVLARTLAPAASQLLAMKEALEEMRAHISEQATHAETRIQDGIEMGAAVWRIALEDVARENRVLLSTSAADKIAEGLRDAIAIAKGRPLTGGVTELIERLQRRRDDAAALGGSSEIYLEEIDELIELAVSNASRGG